MLFVFWKCRPQKPTRPLTLNKEKNGYGLIHCHYHAVKGCKSDCWSKLSVYGLCERNTLIVSRLL